MQPQRLLRLGGTTIAGTLAMLGILALVTLPLAHDLGSALLGGLLFLGGAGVVLYEVNQRVGLEPRSTAYRMAAGGLVSLWIAVFLLEIGRPGMVATLLVAGGLFLVPAAILEALRQHRLPKPTGRVIGHSG